MTILDTIFPSYTCLVCRGEINHGDTKYTCDACAKKLPLHEHVCTTCGCEVAEKVITCSRCVEKKKPWHFNKARSAFSYEDPVIGLILRLKYNAEGDVARFVANFLADVVKKHNMTADALIPIPLAPKRFRQRGYNQAGLIAKELSTILKVPVVDDVLFRTSFTTAQKEMSHEERKQNLRGAFDLHMPCDKLGEKRVLLIDDVFTTGSTVDECARILKKAKPKSIEVLTIAGVGQERGVR